MRDSLRRKDENDEEDDVLTPLPPPELSKSSSLPGQQQHGGGLGTPTGAMTIIRGFSDEKDPIAAVLNKHGLGWPGTCECLIESV